MAGSPKIGNPTASVLSYVSTILYLGPKRVFVYSNDHPPAHVHVSSAGSMAKFELNCEGGPVVCVSSRGYSDPEITGIRKELETLLRTLCIFWKDNYGDYT